MVLARATGAAPSSLMSESDTESSLGSKNDSDVEDHPSDFENEGGLQAEPDEHEKEPDGRQPPAPARYNPWLEEDLPD